MYVWCCVSCMCGVVCHVCVVLCVMYVWCCVSCMCRVVCHVCVHLHLPLLPFLFLLLHALLLRVMAGETRRRQAMHLHLLRPVLYRVVRATVAHHVCVYQYIYISVCVYKCIDIYPPAPMNHVKYLRAGPAEMPFRNWYTADTNHFHLTDSVRWK